MANKAPAAPKKSSNISPEQQQQISEDVSKKIDQKQEAAQAAERAQYCQKKAKELTDAAKGAGDPDERQKLLNEALNKQVEAETFGKTAKYLQTGACQGLVAGAGLGAGIGVGLGTVTGTLVAGTTGTITGGIGAGVGLGVGALHGPWFKVGDLMGGTIRKITGDLPGWKATKEQKEALEKMVNGVQETEAPSEDELEMIRASATAPQSKPSSGENVTAGSVQSGSSAPSQAAAKKSTGSDKRSQQKKSTPAPDRPKDGAKMPKRKAEENSGVDQEEARDQTSATPSKTKPGKATTFSNAQKGPQKSAQSTANSQTNRDPRAPSVSSSAAKTKTKTPARPSLQSNNSTSANSQNVSKEPTRADSVQQEEAPKKKPRKLEVRASKAGGSPGTKRTTQRVRN